MGDLRSRFYAVIFRDEGGYPPFKTLHPYNDPDLIANDIRLDLPQGLIYNNVYPLSVKTAEEIFKTRKEKGNERKRETSSTEQISSLDTSSSGKKGRDKKRKTHAASGS